MKYLNMIHILDSRGRITIPTTIRRTLGYEAGDRLNFFIENNVICIRKKKDVTQPHVFRERMRDTVRKK